jgi:hypothetical protein
MGRTRGWPRWLTLGSVLLTLGSVLPARAGENDARPAEHSDVPVTALVNLSVTPELSTNHRLGPRVRNVLSLGLAIDRPYEITGLQFSLGAARVVRSVYGLQLGLGFAEAERVAGIQVGGFGGIARGPVIGLQATPGIAFSGSGSFTPGDLLPGVGIQLAGVGAMGDGMYGLQVIGGFSMTMDVRGVQTVGLISYARHLRGVQVTGLLGITESFKGLQWSGLTSVSGASGVGLQVAGLVNWANEEHTGLQVAPFNRAKSVLGVQLGLVNRAEFVMGAQIGLINLAGENSKGARFGLVNLVRGVPSALDVWGSELVPVNAAWRTGTPALHSLVGVGVMALGGPRPTALVGMGTNVMLRDRLDFSPDLVYSHAFRLSPVDTAAQVLQLRLPLRWALRDGLWLQAGPTLNAGRFIASTPGYLPYLGGAEPGSWTVRFWAGGMVGVSVPLPWPEPIVHVYI